MRVQRPANVPPKSKPLVFYSQSMLTWQITHRLFFHIFEGFYSSSCLTRPLFPDEITKRLAGHWLSLRIVLFIYLWSKKEESIPLLKHFRFEAKETNRTWQKRFLSKLLLTNNCSTFVLLSSISKLLKSASVRNFPLQVSIACTIFQCLPLFRICRVTFWLVYTF